MIEIKGKCVVKGRAEGTALVADTTLSFWGEVDAVAPGARRGAARARWGGCTFKPAHCQLRCA